MPALVDRLRARYARVPPVTRGMLLITLSTLGFSGMHATIRHVSDELHPFEIAFFRNLFGFSALTPYFLRYGFGLLRTQRLGLHALRGSVQVFGMLMFFTAVSITPLAKVSALSFTAPLFATLGAVLVLGERIRARRMVALAIGFAGAVIIVRPGAVPLDLGAVLALTSSAIWASAMLMIKSLSRTESSITITAYMGVFLTPLSLLPALFVWRWPTADAYLWLLVLGTLGTMGHVAMAQAFKEADASAILPLDFSRLIWASLLGFFLFGQVPEVWTWNAWRTCRSATTSRRA